MGSYFEYHWIQNISLIKFKNRILQLNMRKILFESISILSAKFWQPLVKQRLINAAAWYASIVLFLMSHTYG